MTAVRSVLFVALFYLWSGLVAIVCTPLLAGPPGPITLVLFTATMILAYDISYYTYHVAQHRFPFMWELHKVHHSAEVMVGITKDRVHPLDDLMNRIWDGVIPGIAFGIWSVIALNPVEVVVFGLNVYVLRNILMMDFVRHTHLPISFGPLDNVVLSPHWHQVHHSVDPRHYDKNFGLLFSFWDRLFGTFQPEEERPTYGLTKNIKTYNPVFIAFNEWGDMFREAWKSGSAKNYLNYLWWPPGWRHDGRGNTVKEMRKEKGNVVDWVEKGNNVERP